MKSNAENLETQNKKIYKPLVIDNLNMIPGDPTGLPDESFFISGFFIKYVRLNGGCDGRYNCFY